MFTRHNGTAVPPPLRNLYSHVVRIPLGPVALVLVSGQLPVEDDGTVRSPGDLEAQSERSFALLAALLADQGAGFDDVVQIRTYLTDIEAAAGYVRARSRWITGAPPTSTTVAVSRLVHPDALVEIEVAAVVAVAA